MLQLAIRQPQLSFLYHSNLSSPTSFFRRWRHVAKRLNLNIDLLYILAAIHVHSGNVTTIRAIDNHICHSGTPKGMRNIMATGDVNGISDNATLNPPDGESTMVGISSNTSNKGTVNGNENNCVSVSLSLMAPAAAKRVA